MITVYRRDVTTIEVHGRSRRGVSAPIFLVVLNPSRFNYNGANTVATSQSLACNFLFYRQRKRLTLLPAFVDVRAQRFRQVVGRHGKNTAICPCVLSWLWA